MKQEYHSNAVTNLHIRKQIKESSATNFELAGIFNIYPSTSGLAIITLYSHSAKLSHTLYLGCSIKFVALLHNQTFRQPFISEEHAYDIAA